MKKTRALLSVLFNLATVVLTVYSVCCYIVRGATGNMFGMGSQCFIFYTTDSNVLAALCCLPLTERLSALFSGTKKRQRTGHVLGLIALSALLVLSILFLLGQTFNPFIYFRF